MFADVCNVFKDVFGTINFSLFEVHLFSGVAVKSSRTNCLKDWSYPPFQLFFFNKIFENSRRLYNDLSISWLHFSFVIMFRLDFWWFIFIHDCLKHFEKFSILAFIIIVGILLWLANRIDGILFYLWTLPDSGEFFKSALCSPYFEVSRFHFSGWKDINKLLIKLKFSKTTTNTYNRSYNS